MGLVERMIFLAIGGAIGFVLGYIVARLREIQEELDEVAEIERSRHRAERDARDEKGASRTPTVRDILLFLVVGLVAFSAIAAGTANTKLGHTVKCITNYNVHQGEALGSRDSAIKAGTKSEIKLWTEYAKLYALATKDPSKIPQAQEALNKAILSHRDALIDTQVTRNSNPYPDPDILKSCKEHR